MANKQQYKIIDIKNALIKAKGFISQAARILKCDQSTVRNYIARYPELEEIRNDCREEFLDLAESKLISNINNNDNTAIIFFLKTQGKSRGYQDKQEIEQKTENEIIINFSNENKD